MAAPTPEQLRRLALAARARAELLMRQAAVYQRAADELEGLGGLQTGEQKTTVNTTMQAVDHSVNISAAKSSDPLVAAANAADPPLTLRRLALQVGVHVSALSMARKGVRGIRRDKAEAIARLTGFEAIPANWPGGILD